MKKRRITTIIITIVLVISSAIFVAFKAGNDFKLMKSLDIFFAFFKELNLLYVDDLDPEQLIEAAINGMLSQLDPYTSYIPAEEKKNYRFMTTGEYGGIGSLIRTSGKYPLITDIYQGYPAHKAGLRVGDSIISINNNPVVLTNLKEISETLKGPPGTDISITIHRPFPDTIFSLVLRREKISIKSVSYYGKHENNTGYIRLDNFTQDAYLEVKEALIMLKQQGITSVILDLRGNPGGLLNEAVEICNIFIRKNQLIVSTKGKTETLNTKYFTEKDPIDTLIPLAILVNNGSASASEVIAGAVQDLDRGVVIGERTFGKGLVQSTRNLVYDAQIKVTIAKYYTPSGRCIQIVDYSKRGKGVIIAADDTARHIFKTRNGRIVKESTGIIPDVEINADEMSRICYTLYVKNHIFNFATWYTALNPSPLKPSDIKFTDSDFNLFLDFIKDKEYDYITQSEEQLDELIKRTKNEKYYEKNEPLLNELKKNIGHDKNKDIENFKPEIMQVIVEEIAGRYFFHAGTIFVALPKDMQYQKALQVVSDRKTYYSILSVGQ